ncbi:hypothetical protein [Fusobacterium necrophorum]|uniref:Uncharacterized protein n=1 Tax=Fusobacterium necrophorum DJ-2 TaxID=1441737 RepID=A0AB73C394_9FUSO|nr:hypothetical protein [Fusobacterium necrophorum]KDE64342.1 hypothetical protein FUSO5_06595 [Fusobacterium necrophorum BFTR-1]KDE66147.1 hypothetical protein FUSO4_05140 [Fusobacterium necrophorum DJ-1]KDE68668.1 hypothetical protein FUSO6_08135 [Fusobacterium necrophorum DAB]KDE72254.1 hypothetical protein FUSO8_05885 [Fusobacterium necrophorum DJ-2]
MAKGISIEKFLLYDRQTKKTFNPDDIKNLSLKEQMEYKNKNVYPMIEGFYIFNDADKFYHSKNIFFE